MILRKLSIAVINPYLNALTGVVRLTFDVAQVLKSISKHVEVITFGTIDKEVLTKYSNVNVPIYVPDESNLKRFSLIKKIAFINKLRRKLKDLPFDVLFFTDGYYLVRGFRNILKILYAYFPYSLSYNKSFRKEVEDAPLIKKLKRYMAKELEKLLIYKDEYVKGVIVYSNFVKQVFKRYLGIVPYVLMPPLNTDFFVPPPNLDRKFNSNTKIILCVTRFHPNKEHELVIEAFKRYIKRRDTWLIIAGYVSDMYYFEFIKRLASKDYRIVLIPNPSDQELLKLYQGAIVFWYVHEEHCATTPLEAMACATPVIMLNKPGLNEVVQPGINGYLANNLKELGKVTEQLLNDVETLFKLGISARNIVVKAYGYATFKANLEKILEKILRTG